MSGTTYAEAALERWEELSFTHALRAVSPERVLREAVGATGALAGLCFSVKDLFPVAGVESCAGSLTQVGNVPRTDPPLVAAVRDAGAVVVGKGVCPEFGFGVDTENRLDGRVVHPNDPSISPGGSSGGDAVAVSARVVDFALAGDYGGSARWPAQAMGILGLRCGVGRAPARDQIGAPAVGQQARLDVPGILARDASVLRRVVGVLMGDGALRPRTRRIVVVPAEALGAVSPEVAAGMEDACRRVQNAGYDLVDASPVVAEALVEAYAVYRRLRELTDTHDGVRALVDGREDLLAPSSLAVLAAAEASTQTAERGEVEELVGKEQDVRQRVTMAVEHADALLLPVAVCGAIGFGEQVLVGGTAYDATALHGWLRAVSLTGLPAISMPVAERVSVQLVGPAGAEARLCDLAEVLVA
ncbi:MAG TPA: amidase [Jatrophihabitans sp.]|jgi:amidase